MSNIGPIPFAHHLLAPPMKIPFGMKKGGNIMGADRPQELPVGGPYTSYIRPHEGIDLFPINSTDDSVFAVNWGTIESVRGSSPNFEIAIRHHPHSSGVFTIYIHLGNVEPNIIQGYEVQAGELLGHIDHGLNHLHFLWARMADPSDNFRYYNLGIEVRNRIPMDPIPLLYSFEAYRWPSDPVSSTAAVTRYQHEDSYPYSKISRIRVISWPDRRAATWLLQVEMPDRDTPTSNVNGEFFYLPINNALPHERLMIDIIRDAFNHDRRIKLGWRDSYFYGIPRGESSRKMIEDVRVRP